jgi:hypothetical protein
MLMTEKIIETKISSVKSHSNKKNKDSLKTANKYPTMERGIIARSKRAFIFI